MNRYYTYRIYPDNNQEKKIAQMAGCSRYIYNFMLTKRHISLVKHEPLKDSREASLLIPEMKKTIEWLKECPSQVLQMSLRQLDNDWLKFKQGGNFPVFQSKKKNNSIKFPQGVRIKYRDDVVKVPVIGTIKAIYDRKLIGKIKIVTLYKTATGKYYISVLVNTEKKISVKLPVSEKTIIGISQGINTWYALSNGTRISKPKRISDSERNVRLQQRSLNRKVVGSNRRRKQLQATLRAKERLNNRKRDYLQKVSTKLVIEYDTIVMEHGSDSLKALLRYKSLWYSKNFIEIGRCPPCPDICSVCGTMGKPQGVSWQCESCGVVHNRNHNNALNVKNMGVGRYPSGANTQV